MRWFLVDRVLESVPGKSIKTVKCFSRSEVFFMDHFHGFPIVPGVLQIEMMATSGGKILKLMNNDLLPVVGSVKGAKFYRNVRPGDQCIITMELLKFRSSYALCEGRVEVNGEKVSEATIMYGLMSAELLDPNYVDPVLEEWRKANGIPTPKRRGQSTVEVSISVPVPAMELQ